MYALFDGQIQLGKTQITDSLKKIQIRRLLVAAVAYTVPCRPVFEVFAAKFWEVLPQQEAPHIIRPKPRGITWYQHNTLAEKLQLYYNFYLSFLKSPLPQCRP